MDSLNAIAAPDAAAEGDASHPVNPWVRRKAKVICRTTNIAPFCKLIDPF